MWVWSSKRNSYKKWVTIYKHQVSIFLQRVEHQAELLHSVVSQASNPVESSNKTIMTTLKKRLFEAKGNGQTSYLESYDPITPPFGQQSTKSLLINLRHRSSHTSGNDIPTFQSKWTTDEQNQVKLRHDLDLHARTKSKSIGSYIRISIRSYPTL